MSTATALMSGLEVARTSVVTPLMFEHQLLDDAIDDRRHIVLPEGDEERILRAADVLLRRNVADLTLLGEPMAIRSKAAHLGIDVSAAGCSAPTTRSCASGSRRSTTSVGRTRASTSRPPATSSSTCPTSAR